MTSSENPLEQGIEEMMQEFEASMTQLAEQRNQINELKITHSSADKKITVTVNAMNVVEDLKFSDKALENISKEQLAAAIIRTLNEAAAKVKTQVDSIHTDMGIPGQNLMDELFPDLAPIRDMLNVKKEEIYPAADNPMQKLLPDEKPDEETDNDLFFRDDK